MIRTTFLLAAVATLAAAPAGAQLLNQDHGQYSRADIEVGQRLYGPQCQVCHGDGVVERTEPLEFRVKPGTRDGQRIRLAGKGNAGLHGGPFGDLYIIIRIGEHPVFRRDGDDIYATIPVSAMEAALGAKIEVPTIDGRAQLRVPPGTQSGQKLRLREKGVPSATKDGVRGDQIVEVKIVVPEARDLKVRELWQELQKLTPEDPRQELWNKV